MFILFHLFHWRICVLVHHKLFLAFYLHHEDADILVQHFAYQNIWPSLICFLVTCQMPNAQMSISFSDTNVMKHETSKGLCFHCIIVLCFHISCTILSSNPWAYQKPLCHHTSSAELVIKIFPLRWENSLRIRFHHPNVKRNAPAPRRMAVMHASSLCATFWNFPERSSL